MPFACSVLDNVTDVLILYLFILVKGIRFLADSQLSEFNVTSILKVKRF